MSFFVCPVRVNLTSMTSPDDESTTPGPNVLWEMWSPAANDSAVLTGSRRTGVGLASAGRDEPPVERVCEPNTWPP